MATDLKCFDYTIEQSPLHACAFRNLAPCLPSVLCCAVHATIRSMENALAADAQIKEFIELWVSGFAKDSLGGFSRACRNSQRLAHKLGELEAVDRQCRTDYFTQLCPAKIVLEPMGLLAKLLLDERVRKHYEQVTDCHSEICIQTTACTVFAALWCSMAVRVNALMCSNGSGTCHPPMSRLLCSTGPESRGVRAGRRSSGDNKLKDRIVQETALTKCLWAEWVCAENKAMTDG